jgi:hypothetical protein
LTLNDENVLADYDNVLSDDENPLSENPLFQLSIPKG